MRRSVAHRIQRKSPDQISRLINCTLKMADLREPFELCKVLQNGSLIGISRLTGDENVLLTFSDRRVLVYNVSMATLRREVEE